MTRKSATGHVTKKSYSPLLGLSYPSNQFGVFAKILKHLSSSLLYFYDSNSTKSKSWQRWDSNPRPRRDWCLKPAP